MSPPSSVDPIDSWVRRRAGSEVEWLPAADAATLLRRLTLDLTGLPPTREELAAFLEDPSDVAYRAVVERLLASTRHAEHMAHYWLDAARYGDTHGLHLDNYREIWPYRDWVIRAYERNLPFHRFAIEQLAGDLLPEAGIDSRLATGFVRSHVTTNEGGSIEEEVHVRNVIDRVNTFGTVFLGLTVSCAQCHDHKFDPISQRDYYRLFAFFNNEDGPPMDGNAKVHEPSVAVPNEEQAALERSLEQKLTALDARIGAALDEYSYEEPVAVAAAMPVETIWLDDEVPSAVEVSAAAARWIDVPRRSGSAALEHAVEGLGQHYFRGASTPLRIGAGDTLFVHVWIDPTNPPREVMLQWHDVHGSWEHRAYWGENLISFGADGQPSRRNAGALPNTGRWCRLEVPAADVGLTSGALVDGLAFTQHSGRVIWDAAGVVSAVPQSREDFVWVDDEIPIGAKPEGEQPNWQWHLGEHEPKPASGDRALRRSQGKGLNQDFFTGAKPPLKLVSGDRLFAHVYLDPKDPPRAIQLQFHDGSWDHRVRWGDEAHGPGRPNGGDFRAGDLPPTGEWVRLEVDLADVGLAVGREIDGFAFTQVGGTVYWDAAGVNGFALRDEPRARSFAAWAAAAGEDSSLDARLRDAARKSGADRSSDEQRDLRRHFLRHVFAASRRSIATLEVDRQSLAKEQADLRVKIPTSLVMRERAEMRPSHMLRRGEYDKRGDAVARAVPEFLPPMREGRSKDRLGLAQWLFDECSALTARVAVNRLWQQFFGVGLVKTAEDFGTKGETPAHPELLDWLANRFIASGWDTRDLVRTIVTSAAYRRSSAGGRAAWSSDPENRKLLRGSRFRLDAEVVRDQALFLGGLLVEQVGGPGVKPPQPEGLWSAVAYVGSNTMRFIADAEYDKTHRRSVYTFWKKTSPPPQLTILDAPSREECRVRRERTNTPMQALMLWNDPQYLEAAAGFARRVLASSVHGDEERIGIAFEMATSRRPSVSECRPLLDLVRAQRARFAADRPLASRFLEATRLPSRAGEDLVELSAWTVMTSVLLNLDEVITRS
ncbi:MAG: DUF1549 and DUF1553 domain-containing protein [Planctomycetota bacterium]